MTSANDRPLRVIHCGTGTAGGLALAAILDDPAMELVGLLVHGEGKRGKDAGTLAGRRPVGVTADAGSRSSRRCW